MVEWSCNFFIVGNEVAGDFFSFFASRNYVLRGVDTVYVILFVIVQCQYSVYFISIDLPVERLLVTDLHMESSTTFSRPQGGIESNSLPSLYTTRGELFPRRTKSTSIHVHMISLMKIFLQVVLYWRYFDPCWAEDMLSLLVFFFVFSASLGLIRLLYISAVTLHKLTCRGVGNGWWSYYRSIGFVTSSHVLYIIRTNVTVENIHMKTLMCYKRQLNRFVRQLLAKQLLLLLLLHECCFPWASCLCYFMAVIIETILLSQSLKVVKIARRVSLVSNRSQKR